MATLWYTRTVSYSGQGQVQSETVTLGAGLSATTSYGYDGWERPNTLTYPGGEVVTTLYNSMGLPGRLESSVQGVLVNGLAAGGGSAFTVEYDVFGQVTAMKLPSGGSGDLWRRQEYGGYATPSNQSGLLTRLQVGSYADADALLKLEYGYDSYGNVKTLSENGGAAASFGYDDQSKLTSAYGRSFGWTASGTFLSFEGKSASYAGAPLHGMETLAGANVYAYDAAGNVGLRSVGGVTQTLGWTAANELRWAGWRWRATATTTQASASCVRWRVGRCSTATSRTTR